MALGNKMSLAKTVFDYSKAKIENKEYAEAGKVLAVTAAVGFVGLSRFACQ